MKKFLSISVCALLGMILFTPILTGVCMLFGYKLSLTYPWVFAIVIAILTAIPVLLTFLNKEETEGKVLPIVSAVLLPCALLNTVFYVRPCGMIWLVLSVLICAGCGYLAFRHGQPMTLRAGSMVLSASLLLPLIFICFVLSVDGNTQNNTVVNSVDSPSGKYYAQIIDNDQGEMGGFTVVNVYNHKSVNVGLFEITKKHQRIYLGEHDEYKTMVIAWKDDNCLLINAKEYPVK